VWVRGAAQGSVLAYKALAMCLAHEVVYYHLAERTIASVFTPGPNCRDLKILGRKGRE